MSVIKYYIRVPQVDMERIVLILLLIAGTSQGIFAQQAREVFGKNRIQYKQFDWVYLSGENFDVYYYGGRKAAAQQALKFLDSEFDRMTDLLGWAPYFKTRVFLYNSLNDLRQSNMGLNNTVYNVGGETEFIRPYVEVAHLGSEQEFKDELLYQISNLFVNDMMFGGNLKDMFQSSILMNLPEWFVEGASQYVAKGWSIEMDDYIRQLMDQRKSRRATKLSGKDAAFVGQSIWNFIGEKYGKSSVGNILNYTRVTRNEERSVAITIGISFKQLMNEWRKYYGDMSKTAAQSYLAPSDSFTVVRPSNRTTEYTSIKISPDGEYLAYSANDRGYYEIKVKSLKTGKEKTILKGGSKVVGQRVDYRLPIISWADATTLGVIGVKKGEFVFWLYDLKSRTKIPRELDRFSNIRSMEFSGSGNLLILSADFDGRSDLFLLSSRRDRVRRLTNDNYDDLDPSFIPNTNQIIFSSNRLNDSLQTGYTADITKLPENFSLFIYDLDSTTTRLTRVTNTVSKDIAPKAIDPNTIYYLSDQRGIINLFKFTRNNGIYSQVTNFNSSLRDYDLNTTTGSLSWISERNHSLRIFNDPAFNFNRQVFTPATRRKELQQIKSIREKRKAEVATVTTTPTTTPVKQVSIRDLLNNRIKETQQNDTTQLDTVKIKEEKPPVKPETPVTSDGNINTNQYVFEDEAKPATKIEDTFINRFTKAQEQKRMTGPFPYETKFSANNLVTSMVVDPMRGLGVSIETQMNDMLESYRFFGGIMSRVDLRGGDIFAEFQYLPRLIDFSARFDRKAIYWIANPSSQGGIQSVYNYSLHRMEMAASLPISDRLRISVKPFGSVARTVSLGNNDYLSLPPTTAPENNWYAGVRSEIVYDNSVTTGLNLIEGTRAKILFNHTQGVQDANLSFSQVSIDVRHYQKIYKEIVFAVRGFAGTFYGNAPKVYLLGGMDNWLFNKSRKDGKTSDGTPNPLGISGPTQDLLFTEYATSLRGFDYGTLFGNNVVLANAELRIPLVRALSSNPISSNFLRNMQFTLFYDIGTSWSGEPPFNGGTSVSYEEIISGPFQAQIKNYLNPWLYSYGVGMRTVMLGYYIKFDVAWPVENYEVNDPKLNVTLGFDF